jgi:hypothetical protein
LKLTFCNYYGHSTETRGRDEDVNDGIYGENRVRDFKIYLPSSFVSHLNVIDMTFECAGFYEDESLQDTVFISINSLDQGLPRYYLKVNSKGDGATAEISKPIFDHVSEALQFEGVSIIRIQLKPIKNFSLSCSYSNRPVEITFP